MAHPYKFSGLGLIVKVEDEKRRLFFDLERNQKIAELQISESRFGNNIKVKRKFLKQQKKFNKDPMSFFQNQGGGFWKGMGSSTKNGNSREKNDGRKG